MPYEEEIISIIESFDLRIVHIVRHRPQSMASIVKAIYSDDYAPIQHLKGKTRYLLSTEKEVLFLFVENRNPCEIAVGEGLFRHLECSTIKTVKGVIRQRFNPQKEGIITHDHVVHASDNPLQTHRVLQWLGYSKGVAEIVPTPSYPIRIPHHISPATRIAIERVSADKLFCSQVIGDRWDFSKILCPLTESIQFRAALGDMESYERYILKYRGTAFKDMYSVGRFRSIIESAAVLRQLYYDPFIICTPREDGSYLLLDGVHRASALAAAYPEMAITAAILHYGKSI
ncbi:hypothetical protein IMF23_10295 [Chelatococcus daeguensis]|uniref:hypothetical protein n=1 Tax=Chelatococcus daeguensis TaxID=444444 RepID=UPI0018DFDF83|nr:hypothetical protein [Chelatococcus daeguensis]MBM3083821.1 hypothetical protein [Chelatococcus daeguensis]